MPFIVMFYTGFFLQITLFSIPSLIVCNIVYNIYHI